jgi:hypothetical protein
VLRVGSDERHGIAGQPEFWRHTGDKSHGTKEQAAKRHTKQKPRTVGNDLGFRLSCEEGDSNPYGS